MRGGALIGRETELAWLEEAVGEALAGRGALVLLAGAASPSAALPYGPMLGALRGYLRSAPGALASCGPLQGHLALLLPELGPSVTESDRATLFESLRCALATIA